MLSVQKARSKHPVQHIHTGLTRDVLPYGNESITVQYISFFLLFISSPENNIDFGKNELKTEKDTAVICSVLIGNVVDCLFSVSVCMFWDVECAGCVFFCVPFCVIVFFFFLFLYIKHCFMSQT